MQIHTISVSILTIGELYVGAYNSIRVRENVQRVREFLANPGPQVLTLDDTAVDWFGKFKADLRRSGQIIGDIDLLIAGIAVDTVGNNLRLVTNNTAHFDRIPELALENWLN